MSFFKKFKDALFDHVIIRHADPACIYSPLGGTIIPLQEIGDGVFSEGILGSGCGINPLDGKIFAPFDGEVVQIAETKHALGLKSDAGIELLVHVGLDTVSMHGAGFRPLVKLGDRIRCGELLMEFSIPEIKAAGHSITTVVVVTNSDEYSEITLCAADQVTRLEKLLQVKGESQ